MVMEKAMIIERGGLRFEVVPTKMNVIEHCGLKFDSIPGDKWVLDEVFRQDVYRLAGRNLQYENVLDFGGYKGMFSLRAAALGAIVKVYEPRPDNFEVLLRNIELNGFGDRITAIEAAVWSEAGESRSLNNFYSDPRVAEENGSAGNSGGCPLECCAAPNHTERSGPIVQLVSLGQALENKRWAFVKMDIEGSEVEVLSKATDSELRQIDFLSVELHDWCDRNGRRGIIDRIWRVMDVELSEGGDYVYARRK